MSTFIEILNCFIEVTIVLFFFNQMLTSANRPPFLKLGIIASVFAVHTARSFLIHTTYLNYTLTFILWATLAFFLYKDSLLRKCSTLLIYIFTMLSTDILTRSILSFMFDISNSPMNNYTGILRYIGMSIVSITMFAMLAIISALFKKKSAPVDLKFRIVMVLFPVFSLFIIVCCDIFLIISGSNNLNHAAMLSFIIICLLFFNVILFEFMKSYSAKIQLEGAKALIRQQEENYNNIQLSENELSTLRHDILNHIATMETMLIESHTDDAKKLLDELKNSPQLSRHLTFTNDSALDAILNLYSKKARLQSISYTVKTNNMSSPVSMSPLDKSTVLTNALNNAFEACANVENPFVVIDLFSDKEIFKICIENSSLPIKKSNGIFPTTKTDFKNHGYGIKSIETTIEKYNGMVTFSHADNITKLILLARNINPS